MLLILLVFLASWQLCVRVVFQPVDDTGHAVFDQRHVEVDSQAKPLIRLPQIGQKLLFVNRRESLHGLGATMVWIRNAASTISLAMAFPVLRASYSFSLRRQDAKNAIHMASIKNCWMAQPDGLRSTASAAVDPQLDELLYRRSG